MRTLITYIKNQMLTEKEIKALSKQKGSPLRAADCDINIAAIYERYNRWLREQHLMDYDDQMVYALTILRKVPQVLEHFQEQYRYICVDEAQDTSRIQHTIIALLASKFDNLFMVGDEDQSIYGFRAACPEALARSGSLYTEEHAPACQAYGVCGRRGGGTGSQGGSAEDSPSPVLLFAAGGRRVRRGDSGPVSE